MQSSTMATGFRPHSPIQSSVAAVTQHTQEQQQNMFHDQQQHHAEEDFLLQELENDLALAPRGDSATVENSTVEMQTYEPPQPEEQETDSVQQPQTANLSHVNGKGLWRSWQRSFRQPVDALLDLIDNAIDANRGHGRVRIDTTDPTGHNQAEGIVLINTYPPEAHKDMKHILEVFSSQKEVDAIGENGVGVKQASANLSNFSIVVSKNRNIFQLGILCVSLQKAERIFIPSYTLDLYNREIEMDSLCDNDDVFSTCMEFLGGRKVPTDGEDGEDIGDVEISEEDQALFVETGKSRLLTLMDLMYNSPEWKSSDNVFALWLDQMRTKESAEMILEGLKNTLPKTYLHLRKEDCDLRINGVEPQYHFWERNLAELTAFPLCLSSTEDVTKAAPGYLDAPTINAKNIRIFVGFNPVRSSDKDEQSAAQLYIYSRECGRLVKFSPDCRFELQLSAGGTQFAQGLTIILDDYKSSLPLTPTKQDIAWGDGENGKVHEKNVTSWLRAVITTYYNFHLDRFEGKKGDLNVAVRNLLGPAKLLKSNNSAVTPLAEFREFTKMGVLDNNRFVPIKWMLRAGRLAISSKSSLRIKPGRGTLMQFDKGVAAPAKPKAAKKPSKPAAKKRKTSDDENEVQVVDTSSSFANSAWPGSTASAAVPSTPSTTPKSSRTQQKPPPRKGSPSVYQQRIRELEAELAEAKEVKIRMTALEQSGALLRSRIEQLENENKGMKQELDMKNIQLQELDDQLAALQ